MNKINSELLEKEITRFVHETKGVFSKSVDSIWFSVFGANVPIEIIERHARELGYINGYRWGVEYPTNGKKPDLPDDAVVCVNGSGLDFRLEHLRIEAVHSFKITDQRYKPADTSYLVSEIPESKSNAENVSIDPITELRKEFSSLSPAFQKLMQSDFDRLIEDMERFIKDKAEKKRVVDAVIEAYDKAREDKGLLQAFNELYDLGYLRTPSK